MNAPAKETALVLSGGGAYGAFAVGIMKVLFAGRSPATGFEPLRAKIFAGTSVGAFNASVMVSYPSEDLLDASCTLEDIWLRRVASRSTTCGNGIFRVRGDPTALLMPACARRPVTVAGNFAEDALRIGGYLFARTANFLADSAPLGSRLVALVNVGAFVDSSPYHDLLREVIREED